MSHRVPQCPGKRAWGEKIWALTLPPASSFKLSNEWVYLLTGTARHARGKAEGIACGRGRDTSMMPGREIRGRTCLAANQITEGAHDHRMVEFCMCILLPHTPHLSTLHWFGCAMVRHSRAVSCILRVRLVHDHYQP